jgi:hypothetical protein
VDIDMEVNQKKGWMKRNMQDEFESDREFIKRLKTRRKTLTKEELTGPKQSEQDQVFKINML